MRKTYLLLCLLVFTLSLSACNPSPPKEVVTSRNDGSFDSKVIQPAEESHAPDATEALAFSDTFVSTDGSVTFQIEVRNTISTPNMPVVEVTPHTITEEEARNAAFALCGSSTTFYEAEPTLNERYSKSEILAQINRWAPYTSAEGMQQLFPRGDERSWESNAQTLRETIAYMTSEYLGENSPDYTRPLCQWTFHKSSYYLYGAEAAATIDTSRDNDEISTWASMGDGEDGRYHIVTISRRNLDDYKLNNIYYSATTSGPLLVDYALYRAEKLRTDRPTETQIEEAIQKAQAIMDQIGLGSWKVVFSDIETASMGDVTEYLINVTAVPVFQGVAAIQRPQLDNLKSDTVYASNYYLTEATFAFSYDCTLMDFILYSPVDVKQVLNENVKTLTPEELITRAKEHLSLSDAYEYGAPLENIVTEYTCTVKISQVEYGLTRTKAPNTDESYYYVPASVFRGSVEYCIKDTGEVFYFQEDVPLLMLNAVDGSVIPLTNE